MARTPDVSGTAPRIALWRRQVADINATPAQIVPKTIHMLKQGHMPKGSARPFRLDVEMVDTLPNPGLSLRGR
jgi:hypothetical protein